MSHLQAIEREVLVWPDVKTYAHRFGGTEYRLGKREIGHYHELQDLLELPSRKRCARK